LCEARIRKLALCVKAKGAATYGGSDLFRLLPKQLRNQVLSEAQELELFVGNIITQILPGITGTSRNDHGSSKSKDFKWISQFFQAEKPKVLDNPSTFLDIPPTIFY
jgi:hypothetical protein